ncbi:MAG: UDP-N-acetylmuramoyl-L-alanine--D-glutamate ligase [Deltaproteobacteria bacterium]|nr:UDP-N-acetylmuramoyl-L-alanine--D-glutamate ligase [Deltaproteobacteria bacterium]
MSSVVNQPLGLSSLRDLRRKRVVVIGVGKVGLSAARLGVHLGAEVVLLDDRNAKEVLAQCPEELQSLSVQNEWDAFSFQKDDIVALSPGVPRRRMGVQRALAAGARLVHELELAAAQLELKCVLGITGTNGKSTTTALLGSILEQTFHDAASSPGAQKLFVGGNLGPTLCDAVVNGERPQILALELSSYQLETMRLLHFDGVGITNLAPDHLDRYENVAEYYSAKMSLAELCHGPCFINGKDSTLLAQLKSRSSWVILGPGGTKQIEGGAGKMRIDLNAIASQRGIDVVKARSDVLVGPHNLENVLLAAALAQTAGSTHLDIQKGIEVFAGIPHRLEFLGENGGVRFFNDSKATNVDAAATAVRSFESGIRLIVGGKGKGASYQALLDASDGKVSSVHCIGADGPKLHQEFSAAGFTSFFDENLTSAFTHASKLAVSGEVLLFAPACASFDQFKNFEVRGDAFRALFLVKKEGETA